MATQTLIYRYSRYFQDVLSSNRLPSDINEIQLLKDGSWITHEVHNELQTLDTPRKSMQKIEISDDVGEWSPKLFGKI